MLIQDFLKLLKKKWWFVVLITLLSTICSFVINSYYLTPLYANSTTLLVNDREPDKNYPLTFDDVLLYEKLLGTYKDIILSNRILNPVAEELSSQWKESITTDSLKQAVVVHTSTSSQILTITVTDPDYARATTIANHIAESFSSRLKSIMNVNNVSIIDPAILKDYTSPVSPRKQLNLLISLVLGLVSSISIILLTHTLDTRIRQEEDMLTISQISIIGTIPHVGKQTRKRSKKLF